MTKITTSKLGFGLIVLLGVGCSPKNRNIQVRPENNLLNKAEGWITARNAYSLYAPSNVFKVRGRSSVSNSIKINWIIEDGSSVSIGDKIAIFQFPGDSSQSAILKKLALAKASLNSINSKLQEKKESWSTVCKKLEFIMKEKAIEVDQSNLGSEYEKKLKNIEKSKSVSDFKFCKKKKVLLEKVNQKILEEYNIELTEAIQDKKIFDNAREQFHIRAAKSGNVYLSNHKKYRRKVRKGDKIPTGFEFANITQVGDLAVRFFVSENKVLSLSKGKNLEIRFENEDLPIPIKVSQIGTFPEDLGFHRKNYEILDSRERYYDVFAEFNVKQSNLFVVGKKGEVLF